MIAELGQLRIRRRSGASRAVLGLSVVALVSSLLVVIPVQRAAAAGNLAVQLAQPPATGAVQLNGTNQYVTLGVAADLRSATFTVELWFQRTGNGTPTSTGTGGITNAIPLITKGRAEAETAAADVNYFLGIDATSGKLVADFEEAQVAQGGTTPSANHPIVGNTSIAIGTTWHHAAATYDGTTWNLYLDGASDGTLAVGKPANALTNTLTTVGSALTTTGVAAGFFAGTVDEVRIWSVARTAAQIAAAKDTEITGPQANLLGRWGLNEASGTTAADSSGNGITGALVGSPTRGAGFNGGTNQYVTLGVAADLRSATFTVELWFQRTGNGTPTSTGTGGITNAIPLITKGRAEAETAAADVNYFWHRCHERQVGRGLRGGQSRRAGRRRAPTTRSWATRQSRSGRPGITRLRPTTAPPGTSISTARPMAPLPSASRRTPSRTL